MDREQTLLRLFSPSVDHFGLHNVLQRICYYLTICRICCLVPSQGVILIVFIPRNNIWWLSSAEGVILMVLIAATVSDCFYSSEVAVATINTRQQQSHHWMGLKWRRQDGHGKQSINEKKLFLLKYFWPWKFVSFDSYLISRQYI